MYIWCYYMYLQTTYIQYISQYKTLRPRWMARPVLLSWSLSLKELCQASRVLFSKHSFNKFVTSEEITRGKVFGNSGQNLDKHCFTQNKKVFIYNIDVIWIIYRELHKIKK